MEDVLVLVIPCGECDECTSSDSSTDSQTKLKVNSNAYRQGWEQIFGKEQPHTLH